MASRIATQGWTRQRDGTPSDELVAGGGSRSSRSMLRGQLRRLDYEAGSQLVCPVQRQETGSGEGLPDAIPKTPDEIRESISYAGITARAKNAQVLAESGRVTLKMEAGTTLAASVDRYGFGLTARPGLIAEVDWSPDAVIEQLSYDFKTASFTTDAAGLGPDFIYEHYVVKAANSHFKPKLPTRMQEAGYDPKRDPDFAGTLNELGALFGLEGGSGDAGGGRGGGGGGPAGAEDGLPDEAANFTDASASLIFALKGDLLYPIGGGEAEVRLKSGTSLMLSAEMEGPVTETKVEAVKLRAMGGSIEIQKVKGFAAGLQGLRLHGITLNQGGDVSVDYDLTVEDMTDGVLALFRLFGALGGDRSALEGPIEKTRFPALRERVDAQIAEELTPRLHDLIRQYDAVIPGVSLVEAFGL